MSTVLDIGHGPGTANPDGASSGWCNERELCLDVGSRIAADLAHLRTPCRVASMGAYKSRPNDLPIDIIVSLHADRQASKTPYAVVFVHADDVDSLDAAVCILKRMGMLTSITRCIVGVWGPGEVEGTRLAATEKLQGFRLEYLAWDDTRGPVCIDSYPVEAARLLLEVGSLSHHEHRALLTTNDGRASLAAAIAQGIVDYL